MENKLILQPNSITVARYDMTTLEKDVFFIIISQVSYTPNSKRKFKILSSEIIAWTGKEIDHSQFKKTANNLLNKIIRVPIGNDKYISINFSKSSEYMRGFGLLEIELSEEMSNLLLDLKSNFTCIELEKALKLRSKYSKRIYEMLCQYKDTGQLYVSIEELKQRLCIIDPESKKDKFPKFAWLKKNVLDVAFTEINEKTPMKVEFQPIKKGKAYTHLSFSIIKDKNQQPQIPQKNEPKNKLETYERLSGKYRLSPWQANKVIDLISQENIDKTLGDIQIGIMSKKVVNVGAYTISTFTRKYGIDLLNK